MEAGSYMTIGGDIALCRVRERERDATYKTKLKIPTRVSCHRPQVCMERDKAAAHCSISLLRPDHTAQQRHGRAHLAKSIGNLAPFSSQRKTKVRHSYWQMVLNGRRAR